MRSNATFSGGVLDCGPDEEMDAMRDYFWMVRSGLVEHIRGGWSAFRAGYRAITSEDAHFDSAPPPVSRTGTSCR